MRIMLELSMLPVYNGIVWFLAASTGPDECRLAERMTLNTCSSPASGVILWHEAFATDLTTMWPGHKSDDALLLHLKLSAAGACEPMNKIIATLDGLNAHFAGNSGHVRLHSSPACQTFATTGNGIHILDAANGKCVDSCQYM